MMTHGTRSKNTADWSSLSENFDVRNMYGSSREETFIRKSQFDQKNKTDKNDLRKKLPEQIAKSDQLLALVRELSKLNPAGQEPREFMDAQGIKAEKAANAGHLMFELLPLKASDAGQRSSGQERAVAGQGDVNQNPPAFGVDGSLCD